MSSSHDHSPTPMVTVLALGATSVMLQTAIPPARAFVGVGTAMLAPVGTTLARLDRRYARETARSRNVVPLPLPARRFLGNHTAPADHLLEPA